jgi:hypothetical protein
VRPWTSGRETIDGLRRFADEALSHAAALPVANPAHSQGTEH